MPLEQPNPDDSTQTLMDVIAALELSPGAQAQLGTFVESLTDCSKSQFEPFLTFLLQYIYKLTFTTFEPFHHFMLIIDMVICMTISFANVITIGTDFRIDSGFEVGLVNWNEGTTMFS